MAIDTVAVSMLGQFIKAPRTRNRISIAYSSYGLLSLAVAEIPLGRLPTIASIPTTPTMGKKMLGK